MEKSKPCAWPDGVEVRPDGEHSLYPHCFVLESRLKNVTVEILKCEACGEYSYGWKLQDNTEDITEE